MITSSSTSNAIDRPPPMQQMRSISNSLSSQMAALEAASRDRDEDSQSPDNKNKGKCEIKQEIKKENDDDQLDTSNGAGGGKSVNNESMKQEIKTEPMDVDHSTTNADGSQAQDDIKQEPMSPNDSKGDVKPMVPEPIQPNTLDKKKKCRTFSIYLI